MILRPSFPSPETLIVYVVVSRLRAASATLLDVRASCMQHRDTLESA